MVDLSEEELLNEYVYDACEKYMLKAQAIQNSKSLKAYMKKGNKVNLLEQDPEMKTLDELIMQLQRGEYMVDIPQDIDIADFGITKANIPELDSENLVTIMEPKALSDLRKTEAYKATSEVDSLEEDGIELGESNEASKTATQKKKENRSKYRVISIKDDDGNAIDLVVDQNGKDVATISYDEKGNPSVQLAPEILEHIENDLSKINARTYIPEETIEKEFYLQDIDSFVRAIEEEKIVPASLKDTAERAISAKRIQDNEYTSEDADRAVTETPEEIKIRQEQEEDIKKKIEAEEERVAPREAERDIAEEETKQEVVEEQNVETPQTQPTLDKTDPDKKVEDEEKDESEEEKNDEVKEFCKRKGIPMKSIKAVLIVKDPKPLDDAMENDNLDEHGGEVTIIQYADSITGKSNVSMIQGGAEIKVDDPQKIAENFINKYHMSTGVIKRTEDDETYIDYSDSSGKSYRMPLKRTPDDMSIEDKRIFKEDLEKDLETLQMVILNNPENTELIDKLQIEVFKDFTEAGLEPPEVIRDEAAETEEIEEEQEPEQESEKEPEEDDTYDEVGRRRRIH